MKKRFAVAAAASSRGLSSHKGKRTSHSSKGSFLLRLESLRQLGGHPQRQLHSCVDKSEQSKCSYQIATDIFCSGQTDHHIEKLRLSKRINVALADGQTVGYRELAERVVEQHSQHTLIEWSAPFKAH